MTPWEVNTLQFPRLLSELRATGLTRKQYKELQDSMNISRDEIDALLERAEEEWQTIKSLTGTTMLLLPKVGRTNRYARRT